MRTAEKLFRVYRTTFGIVFHMMNIAIDYTTITAKLAYEFIFYKSIIYYRVKYRTSVPFVNLS
jgi:hypothetical protein